ncbi:hypothetical protein ANCDUO_08055 [Ancylostoma duodenale]|uniref:Paired domain-containing protein n=1 Tax=Ancylostoma duodenale TaxID=51022 RepID=A0A0C2DGU3_9BILA|nr:hypothetical protein ANCDUO_08055 [Ancylostoma duodenale]
MHQDGKSAVQIVKMLFLLRRSVQDMVRRFRELGSIEDRKSRGRPAVANVPKIVKIVRSRPDQNPKRSMRKMAKEVGIGRSSMRNIVTEELNLYPYRLQRAHALIDVIRKNKKKLYKQLRKRFIQSR